MKTPEQWLEEFEESNSGYSRLLLEEIQAIQKDAYESAVVS